MCTTEFLYTNKQQQNWNYPNIRYVNCSDKTDLFDKIICLRGRHRQDSLKNELISDREPTKYCLLQGFGVVFGLFGVFLGGRGRRLKLRCLILSVCKGTFCQSEAE